MARVLRFVPPSPPFAPNHNEHPHIDTIHVHAETHELANLMQTLVGTRPIVVKMLLHFARRMVVEPPAPAA